MFDFENVKKHLNNIRSLTDIISIAIFAVVALTYLAYLLLGWLSGKKEE